VSRRYDLLIFDWDGTLADSAASIVEGMQRAIAQLGLPQRSDEQIREKIGLGFADAVTRLFPEMAAGEVIRLLEGYRRHLLAGGRHDGGPAEAPLFPGALEALRALAAAGYRVAVATGKSRGSLERSLKYHPDVRALMSSSRCADETASKPDPLMLRELLEEEDVAPARALMVGDTEFDVMMARSASIPAVGVICGVHEPERLRQAGALALIEAVRHLPEWLARDPL
jgi:phosphoglycolate phosphatase